MVILKYCRCFNPRTRTLIAKTLSRVFTCSAYKMAKSRFEYVRQFEMPDNCLPNCWIVVRIDGKGFHKFSEAHKFKKPNDERALKLMNESADRVMSEFTDIVLAYGQSDEYSFVMQKKTNTYNRRASKLMTNMVSLFASSYVMGWVTHFHDIPLKYPPAFDARVVLYPSDQNLRDYLSWRQADCHINNMYNTCFWALVQEGGMTNNEAQERLKGTVSGDKNELLFSQFNVNYNEIDELYRKGTVLFKEKTRETFSHPKGDEDTRDSPRTFTRTVTSVNHLHVDIIGKKFWEEHPDIMTNKCT